MKQPGKEPDTTKTDGHETLPQSNSRCRSHVYNWLIDKARSTSTASIVQLRQPHDAAFAYAESVAVLHSASCGGERDRSLISAQSFPRTHDLCESARKACDGLFLRLPSFHCPIAIQMVCACLNATIIPNNSQIPGTCRTERYRFHQSRKWREKKNASSPNGSCKHRVLARDRCVLNPISARTGVPNLYFYF